MVIESTLSKDQFIRLSIARHLQRTMFYIYATLCAAITAYALFQGPLLLLLVAWMPFSFYIISGVIQAVSAGSVKDAPYFLPTRYEFTGQGVTISTSRGQSQLGWEHFQEWRHMVNCYVLVLSEGAILAIPQNAIPAGRAPRFEDLLRQHIGKRGQRARSR